MGKVLLVILIIFFCMILGGLIVVRGVVEEMESQGLSIFDLEGFSGSNGLGNIQDPHDLSGGEDYHINDPTANNLPDNSSNDIPADELTKAYQKYLKTYNALTELMSAGKGDTSEADQAYQDYLEAKKNYEQLAKEAK